MVLLWVLGLRQLQRTPGFDGGGLGVGEQCPGKTASKVCPPVMAPGILGIRFAKGPGVAGAPVGHSFPVPLTLERDSVMVKGQGGTVPPFPYFQKTQLQCLSLSL